METARQGPGVLILRNPLQYGLGGPGTSFEVSLSVLLTPSLGCKSSVPSMVMSQFAFARPTAEQQFQQGTEDFDVALQSLNPTSLDHDDFGLNQFKVIKLIDS